MKKKYKIGEILEVTVEKIIPNGLGLCFAENLTVFVPLSVKGDTLQVEIRKIQGRTAFAKIIEIIKPSQDRKDAECVYFGTCGGCDFQQMNYPSQLEAKVEIIRDCLQRIGRIEYEREIPIIPSPEKFGYRLRTQFHADVQNKTIGFYKRQSHEVIDAKSCPILVPELEEKLKNLRSDLDWNSFSEKMVNIETAGFEGLVSVYSEELFEPTEEVFFEVNGDRIYFNARSFFQGNMFLIKELIETAIGGMKGKTALDLYCGVGLFSLSLAKSFERVYGVEANHQAIKFARKNADTAGLKNTSFFAERVKTFLKENEIGKVDFILLDPPRSGVKRQTLEKITDLEAEKITYVSCNPSTLARDLKILLERGYAIQKITALDLFPQTHHVETVVKVKSKK